MNADDAVVLSAEIGHRMVSAHVEIYAQQKTNNGMVQMAYHTSAGQADKDLFMGKKLNEVTA